MANISHLLKVLQYLEEQGFGSDYVSPDHDIIHFPLEEYKATPEQKVKLEELGCFVDSDSGHYTMFT